MVERRHDGGNLTEQHVAEVRTAIQFIIKSVDRLEGSVTRLEQTVREDFASTGDLEMVKAAVTQLRLDIERRLIDIEATTVKRAADLTASFDARVRAVTTRRDTEARLARWFVRVAIPAGLIGLGTLVWEIAKTWVKLRTSGP